MGLTKLERYYSKQAVDLIYRRRPASVQGMISQVEAHFLHALILETPPRCIVEIGIAAGVSSSVIADALHQLDQGKIITSKLISYDVLPYCYYDREKRVGFAFETMAPGLEKYWEVRVPAMATQVRQDFKDQPIHFLFIDADHKHPWPALDLWACLPVLNDEALVCFHDVNLPQANPKFLTWGAKWLFDALTTDKTYADSTNEVRWPNMGSIKVKNNKHILRDQVLSVLTEFPWEKEVDRSYIEELGLAIELDLTNPNIRLIGSDES